MTIYLIIAAVDFLIGSLALSKRTQRGAIALSLISFSACLWSIELFLFTYIQDRDVLDPWFHLTRLGIFLIPPSLALLVSQLVMRNSMAFKKWVVTPGFTLSITLFVLNNSFFPTTLKQAPTGFLPDVDAIYYGFGLCFLLCLLGSIGFTCYVFRSAAERDKQRIQWLLITLVISFCLGCSSIYLISYDFYLSKFIGGSTNVIFMLLLFYSTMTHHLMDFKLAISLAVSRALLLVFFACLYFAVAPFLEEIPDTTGRFALMLALFMLLLEAYPRILKWLEPNTRRILASQTYDFHKVVEEMRENLRNCNDLTQLSQQLNVIFYNVLKVREYHLCTLGAPENGVAAQAISISDKHKSLQLGTELLTTQDFDGRAQVVMADETQEDVQLKLASLSAACFFPIFWQGKLLAVMLIGRPTRSSFYRYDDIRLMEWMISELGQTLHRISMLEKLHYELAEAKKQLSLLSVMNLYHHDIKAPLSIIDGVISNDLYDEEKRRQVILEQVAWGSHLITTMAALLSGGRKIKVEAVSIEQVLRDCAMVFGRTIPNLTCTFDPAPELQGDAEDLKILFINVLKNAYEAKRNDAELKLQVKTWADSQGIYAAIADNGTGMSQEQLDNLWHGTESTKKGGNGIGLQTIKRIADEHNASIHVESAPGAGTTFTFSFPLPSLSS